MTNDGGGDGPAAQPPPPTGNPAYWPQGYPPPNPGGPIPPPGYGSPPGYGPQPDYPPPPGYAPQYPAYPGYAQPMGPPPALTPGIIPLRPLGLSDIFNAAFSYIRVNPKPTLGLTTIVIVVSQILVLILTSVVPLIIYGHADISQVDDESVAGLLGMFLAVLAVVGITVLSVIALSGMLTVVVGRAVFGASITIGEAWDRVRGRLVALLGLTLLEGLGAALLTAVTFVVIGVAGAVAPGLGALVGVPMVIGWIAVLIYLGTMLSFAPPLIVLERLPVFAAIGRSFTLIRGSFWRVFGISLLGGLVAWLVIMAVSTPFRLVGGVLAIALDSVTGSLVAAAVVTAGAAIGQIITAPFIAGIVVLLYTDRRMRAEAFDLVLQTRAAATTSEDSADATDELWLVRHH